MKDLNVDQIAAMIYEAPLGAYIGRDGADILAAHAADVRQLKEKEFLYHRGDMTNSFYIVTDGRLALVRERTSESDGGIVHILNKGDLVGELSFIDQTPHDLSVQAQSDSEVLSFNAENIKPLITEHPELMYDFMRAVIKRVHYAVTTLSEHERELNEYISTGGTGRR